MRARPLSGPCAPPPRPIARTSAPRRALAAAAPLTSAARACPREECEAFCARAVSLAMARDGSSGGIIRLITITKEGVARRMLTVNGGEVEQHYGEMGRPGDRMAA